MDDKLKNLLSDEEEILSPKEQSMLNWVEGNILYEKTHEIGFFDRFEALAEPEEDIDPLSYVYGE